MSLMPNFLYDKEFATQSIMQATLQGKYRIETKLFSSNLEIGIYSAKSDTLIKSHSHLLKHSF